MKFFNKDKKKDDFSTPEKREENLRKGIDVFTEVQASIKLQFANQPDVVESLQRMFDIGVKVGRAQYGIEVNKALRK